MKPLIESTTGWITGIGRGELGEQFACRDKLALRSCRGASAIGAFSVA